MAAVSMSKRSIRIEQTNFGYPGQDGINTIGVGAAIIAQMQSLGVSKLAVYPAYDFTTIGLAANVFVIEGILTSTNDATLVTHFTAWEASLGHTLDTDVVTVLQGH